MNIYEEIEKCYLENNVDARLNLLFRRIFVVFFVLTMSFVFIFNLGNLINYAIIVALVMFFLIVILSTLLLLIFNGKSKHLVKIGETFRKKVFLMLYLLCFCWVLDFLLLSLLLIIFSICGFFMMKNFIVK